MSHPVPLVSVAIPTFNRVGWLREALDSVRAQDYPALDICVLDNASSDGTAAFLAACPDPRLRVLRHAQNIGLIRNWRRALTAAQGEYVVLLQDDDRLAPDFVRASVQALQADPEAAFSVSGVCFIDADGQTLHRQPQPLPAGRVQGLDLLHRVVAGENLVLHASSVLMRRSALQAVGLFEADHSRHATEFHLYFRLAARHSLQYVPPALCEVRHHDQQDHRISTAGTGPLAMVAERHQAIEHLLRSPRADERNYRLWLADRLRDLGLLRSQYTADLMPALGLAPDDRMGLVRDDLHAHVAPGERLVLIDDDGWLSGVTAGWPTQPLLPGGAVPTDDAQAQVALDAARAAGAQVLVVGWPAFWWLDYYSGWRDQLEREARCCCRNGQLVIYRWNDAPVGAEQAHVATGQSGGEVPP